MSFAVRATQAKKRSLFSSEKARGSLAICQEKMAGSFQQYLATVGGLSFVELPHVSHESVPSGLSRNGISAAAAPFEVLAVSAAPFPGVGEVKYCLHIPLSQFGHQEIQSVECAVVVNSGSGLQDRFDFRYDSRVAFRSDQDAQVADTRCLHPVEFAAQAAAVALRPFGGQ